MAREKKQGTAEGKTQQLGAWTDFRRSTGGSLLLNVLAAVIVIALVQTFFVKMYVVPSGSMEATLQVGDKILVNRMAYAGGVPPRGDVVVFKADDNWQEATPSQGNVVKELVKYFGDATSIGPSHEKFLVKRVIGIPGDVVDCCSSAGQLTINDVPQDEPYIQGDPAFDSSGSNCESTPMSSRCFGPVTVPEGRLLVMGDNRGNSKDSVVNCRGKDSNQECLTLVPLENVIGHTFAVLLPLSRLGGVR